MPGQNQRLRRFITSETTRHIKAETTKKKMPSKNNNNRIC
jgi:hypothetical protein